MGVPLLSVADLATQGGTCLLPLRAVNSLLDCGSVEFPDAFLVQAEFEILAFEMLTQLGDSVKLCSETFPTLIFPSLWEEAV